MFNKEVECLEIGWLKGTGWGGREEGGEGIPGGAVGAQGWALVWMWDWVACGLGHWKD